MKIGEIVKPAVALLVICLVITAALALTYGATEEPIRIGAAQRANQTRQDFFQEATDFEEISSPEISEGEVVSAFKALNGSDTIGYIITAASSGYGGRLEVMVGINADGSVRSVQMTAHEETPGLGSNANNNSFKEQFCVNPPEDFYVVKSGKSSEAQILALSGATITSRAVTNAVNAAYECFTLVGGAS